MRKNEKNGEKGITLIALVVTIVILLILAGVTISMLTGENGIIRNAQNAKRDHQIAEEQERLEMIRTEKYFKYGGKLTLEKFIEELKNDEIIEEEYLDDTYITDKEFISRIEDDNGKIKIEVEGLLGTELPIVIKKINIKTTTSNSIEVDIEVKRGDGATYKYYIKEKNSEDSSYELKGEGVDLTSCIIENLDENKIYIIKVVANDGEAEKTKEVSTKEIEKATGIIQFGNLTWNETTHKASVTITNTKADEYRMQYAITTGSTTTEFQEIANNSQITDLQLSQVISARLYDGRNSGDSATLTVKDDIAPNEASISFSSTNVMINTNITATVILSDSQSGVDLSKCRWAFNTSSSKIIDESLYSSSNTISTETNAQITLNSSTAGTYYLHILTVDNAGNTTQTVSEAITIQEIRGTGEWNGTVNEPLTKIGMTAITYDSSGNPQTVTDKSQWFNYDTTNKKWANAQTTADGSYWVWIPRYEYKITYTNSSDYSQGGTIDINFIPKTQTTPTSGYKIHPAFQNGTSNNYKNGEWDEELAGIWVAKYEMSGESYSTIENKWKANTIENPAGNTEITDSNKTTLRVVSKPGVTPWYGIQWGNCYANAQRYNTNIGLSLDSHLIKNSEWGAVAYLTHSKYGRDGKSVEQNNVGKFGSITSVKTGGSSDATAVTNTSQSSTGNAYGIYDLNGGVWENVAGYISNGNSSLSIYGKSLTETTPYVNTTANAEPHKTTTGYNTKYLTAYPYDSSSDARDDNYTVYKKLLSSRYGDAIVETSKSGWLTAGSWFSGYSFFPQTSTPFLVRSGSCYPADDAGVFAFYSYSGSEDSSYGFRVVLVAE